MMQPLNLSNCVTRDPSTGGLQSSLSRLSAQSRRRRPHAKLAVFGALIARGHAKRPLRDIAGQNRPTCYVMSNSLVLTAAAS
jgi:hypothetical protein